MPSNGTNDGTPRRAPEEQRASPTVPDPRSHYPVDPSPPASAAAAAKPRLRADILSARARTPAPVRHSDNAALAHEWARSAPALLRGGRTLCAYVPAEDEPGSPALLDAALAAGIRILLPVTGPPGPLSWADYTGTGNLKPGRFGIPEPTGPVLAPSAIARAAVVLVPALAVDRRGVRLGRGAGYYDRTLPLAAKHTEFVCVVRDVEYVDSLPEGPHDVRMDAVLTPRRGLVRPDRTGPGREQDL